jgi:hypothetical protein
VRTALPHAPQAGRVEPADHHAALGHQHPLDLAQRGVRVGAQFERVRQHHQVEAVGRKRQGREIGQQRRLAAARRVVHCEPAVRHAVGAQGVDFGRAELQCVIAEHVGHRLVELGLLPCQQVAPRGVANQSCKPII